jgi:uncharacterized membrane protein YbhN (UPF0104 family)
MLHQRSEDPRMRDEPRSIEIARDIPDGGGGTVSSAGQAQSSPIPRSNLWKWVGTSASIAIVALSIYILVHTLTQVSIFDLRNAIRATSLEQIVASCLFTALSYLILTGYDALALSQLRLKVPYRTTALGSFASYAISFTVGFHVVTAGAVRYWIYSHAGLSAGKVARLTVIAGMTFWLGIGAAVALGLVIEARSLTAIDGLPPIVNRAIGVAILATFLAYLVWVALGRRRTFLKGFRLEFPGVRLTLGQVLLGAADMCTASAALYMLMPTGSGLNFGTFATTYAFASLLAMASHAPGGIGVLEATMLRVVSAPVPDVLAALLLFRIIYYLVPFVLALALLGAAEGVRRWRSLVEAMSVGDDE